MIVSFLSTNSINNKQTVEKVIHTHIFTPAQVKSQMTFQLKKKKPLIIKIKSELQKTAYRVWKKKLNFMNC